MQVNTGILTTEDVKRKQGLLAKSGSREALSVSPTSVQRSPRKQSPPRAIRGGNTDNGTPIQSSDSLQPDARSQEVPEPLQPWSPERTNSPEMPHNLTALEGSSAVVFSSPGAHLTPITAPNYDGSHCEGSESPIAHVDIEALDDLELTPASLSARRPSRSKISTTPGAKPPTPGRRFVTPAGTKEHSQTAWRGGITDSFSTTTPTPSTTGFPSPQPWGKFGGYPSEGNLLAMDSPDTPGGQKVRIRKGHWKRGKAIGEGSCGKVYLGMNEDTGELMAVKEVTLENRERHLKELYTEIQVMHKLRHPGIVAYLGAELLEGQRTLCIFQEWVPAGSLHQLIEHFGALSERMTRKYTRQVLEGLAYLHANHVIHRDVKAKNILVDERGTPKLADFGCAMLLQEGGADSMTMSIKGTPVFMAPEILLRKKCGRRVDVWSLGCVVMEMATTLPPWDNMFSHPFELIAHFHEHQSPPQLPDVLPAKMASFLRKCFTWDPEMRPKSKDLLHDDWFTGMDEGTDDLELTPDTRQETPLEELDPKQAMQRLRKASSFDYLNHLRGSTSAPVMHRSPSFRRRESSTSSGGGNDDASQGEGALAAGGETQPVHSRRRRTTIMGDISGVPNYTQVPLPYTRAATAHAHGHGHHPHTHSNPPPVRHVPMPATLAEQGRRASTGVLFQEPAATIIWDRPVPPPTRKAVTLFHAAHANPAGLPPPLVTGSFAPTPPPSDMRRGNTVHMGAANPTPVPPQMSLGYPPPVPPNSACSVSTSVSPPSRVRAERLSLARSVSFTGAPPPSGSPPLPPPAGAPSVEVSPPQPQPPPPGSAGGMTSLAEAVDPARQTPLGVATSAGQVSPSSPDDDAVSTTPERITSMEQRRRKVMSRAWGRAEPPSAPPQGTQPGGSLSPVETQIACQQQQPQGSASG